MRYVVTGKRGFELRARAVYSAKEGVRIADEMILEGFEITSILDRTYRAIDMAQLRSDALVEKG